MTTRKTIAAHDATRRTKMSETTTVPPETTNEAMEDNKRRVEELFARWTQVGGDRMASVPPLSDAAIYHGTSDGVMTALFSGVTPDVLDREIGIHGVIQIGGEEYRFAATHKVDPSRSVHDQEMRLYVVHDEQSATYDVNNEGITLIDSTDVDQPQIDAQTGVADVQLWVRVAQNLRPSLCTYAQHHGYKPKLVHINTGSPESDDPSDHLDHLARMIRGGNAAQGFDPTQDVHRSLLLIISEITEALEAVRTIKDPTKTVAELYAMHWMDGLKPNGPADELADVLIRLLDLMAALKIPIGVTVRRKLAYNATRSKMHGKQF